MIALKIYTRVPVSQWNVWVQSWINFKRLSLTAGKIKECTYKRKPLAFFLFYLSLFFVVSVCFWNLKCWSLFVVIWLVYSRWLFFWPGLDYMDKRKKPTAQGWWFSGLRYMGKQSESFSPWEMETKWCNQSASSERGSNFCWLGE